jgi:Skp family chaperone for outer membrane proteins
MCAPAIAPIALGVASFATQAVGSIANYSQASNQARNEAKAQNDYQQKQYELQTQAYIQQQDAAKRQELLNQEAASKAYVAAQIKVQNEYKQAALEADNLRLKSMQDAADIQASGKSGRSIGILAMDPDRAYGRDLATLGLNLGYAKDDYYQSIESIFDQATSANAEVASSRGPAPSKPTKVKSRTPGKLGLIADIAGATFSGFNTYSSLKAPSATVPKPPAVR